MNGATALRPGERVAWLGLGAMGLRMAAHCARHGFVVLAHDPALEADDPRLPPGVTLAPDAHAALAGATALVTCLPSDQALRSALAGEGASAGLLAALPAGGLVVDCGTTSPATTRALAGVAAGHGHAWVDAPVSGSTPWAEAGRLTALVGGERQAVARARPLIDCFSARVFHLGGIGAGQTGKLCHQLTFMATLLGLGEALGIGTRAGLDRDLLLEAIGACVAPAHVVEFALAALAAGDIARDDGTLGLLAKDLRAVADLAHQLDAAMPLTRAVTARIAELAAGEGRRHNVFRLLELAAPPPGE